MRVNGPSIQADLLIDLDQYAANLTALRELAPTAKQLAVVKANAYGHGAVPIARTARSAGVDWLGAATPAEALALRAEGDTGPLLCWLATPGAPFAELAEAAVDVTASSVEQLEEILAVVPTRPRVQLKVDTGLSRNGALGVQWSRLVDAAAAAQHAGRVELTGVWSHFACSEDAAHPANDSQEQVFRAAVDELSAAGVDTGLRHLANSAATVNRPSSHFDLVRVGIVSYGLRPDPALEAPGVRPILTARAALAHVKEVSAGTSVSYGWRWTAERDTILGLVPVGYGDGIFRAAANRASVAIARMRAPVRGTVCMDQFVVDLGPATRAVRGDVVTLFGPGDDGEPTVDDWAEATGTISYDIVTRLAGRWTRTYLGGN